MEAGHFREVIPHLRRFVPASLLNDAGWERLAARVGDLPGEEVAALASFEFRLGEPEPSADFTVAFEAGGRLQNHYARLAEAAEPGSCSAAVGRFLAAQEPGLAGTPFEYILLEYDVVAIPLDTSPAPGLFAKLRDGSNHADAVATLLGATGWKDRSVESAVGRAVSALPAEVSVHHVGAMPDRPQHAARLGLTTQGEPEQLAELLKRLEWPGDAKEAMSLLADMRPAIPSFIDFHMDIAAEGPLPRFGVSKTLKRGSGGWVRSIGRDWRHIVERLVTLGWCLPEKGEGLLEYPGLHRLFDERGMSILYKGINHVKLSLQGRGVEAKAYVGFTLSRFAFEE